MKGFSQYFPYGEVALCSGVSLDYNLHVWSLMVSSRGQRGRVGRWQGGKEAGEQGQGGRGSGY